MIVWLSVPFSQKDDARRKGAMWSSSNKKWHVENAADLMPFYQWIDDRLKRPTTSRVPERALTAGEAKKIDRRNRIKAGKQRQADANRERNAKASAGESGPF
jgi:hypothetical protein